MTATVDNFPIWKPREPRQKRKIEEGSFKVRLKTLRSAASNFTKREEVRSIIFSTKGTKCYICGGEATQIDHKIAVYYFARDRNLDYLKMNSYDNLFPICKRCNCRYV